MDRISELPEFILHHILSFLPKGKDAAQTSVLSKYWNRAWTSYPVLRFDERDFGVAKALRPCLPRNHFSKESSPELWEAKENFCKFVDNSLFNFVKSKKLRIQRLGINIVFVDPKLSVFIDKWTRLAKEGHVKEIVLSIRARREWEGLPQSIFDAKSLTVLELRGGMSLLDRPQLSINFQSLQKLTLFKLLVDDPMMQKLLSNCPVIEDFCLVYCRGFTSICVPGLVKLKNFTFWSLAVVDRVIRVDIEAPSLQTLFINGGDGRSNCVVKVAASRDLKGIVLCACTITDQFFYDFNSKFPCLEELSMTSCCTPGRVKISNHHLQKLLLTGCKDVLEAEIDTPNLLKFDYEANNLPTSITAPCQWKVAFYVSERAYLDPHWFLGLKQFLTKSHQIEHLHLVISSSVKIARHLERLREVLLPPYCEVRHLQFGIDHSTSSCITLLNVLLWICRPKTLCLNLNEPEKFIKFLYKKLRNIEHPEGCSCGSIKCWLHYLQELEITTSTAMVHKVSLQTSDMLDDLLTLPPGQINLHFKW